MVLLIDQSPTDYLLYYKRATAYFSLQRHGSAQDDFDKVLSLTSNTFDNAHLMKARIYTRDGHFASARTSLSLYIKAKGKKMDKEAEELDVEITEGERLKEKADKERKAQLWNACIETASEALRVASHSVEIRAWRAECALAAGDIESSVGDLTWVVSFSNDRDDIKDFTDALLKIVVYHICYHLRLNCSLIFSDYRISYFSHHQRL